ncbi:CinA family protein [Paraburkholderia sp. J94]|uniref:CinA family protein n=1 Tax=Paraburkholderia sp. J94 TaxID=2805441 RepID=UPI002AB31101|nr:CinA family protein [Paraburkholderia sp. J94]
MNISKQIVGYLKSRGLVLASLETCTAGHIATMLAELPGAESCLDVTLIAHTRAALARLPGIEPLAIANGPGDAAQNEALARALAEALLVQRAVGREGANVALASVGWLSVGQDGRAAAAHGLAWACRQRDGVSSASETVLFTGRGAEVKRSIARRALLGLPRFVDSLALAR